MNPCSCVFQTSECRHCLCFDVVPVALMPDPGLASGPWPKVCTSQVHDPWGEAQQAAVAIGPVHVGGRGRKAALLMGTGEQVKRTVLQVCWLLDQLRVQHQVWCGWTQTYIQKFIKTFCRVSFWGFVAAQAILNSCFFVLLVATCNNRWNYCYTYCASILVLYCKKMHLLFVKQTNKQK